MYCTQKNIVKKVNFLMKNGKYMYNKQLEGFMILKDLKKFFFTSEKTEEKQVSNHKIDTSIDKIIEFFKSEFDYSTDLIIREINLFDIKSCIISIDGMIDKNLMNEIIKTLVNVEYISNNNKDIYTKIKDKISSFPDQIEVETYEDALKMLLAGCALLCLDKCTSILVFGVQGFQIRSVAEPTSEKSQRGSREGFIEVLRINMSMIRRRISNPNLKFETMQLGSTTKTFIAICYMNDRVEPEILNEVRTRLKNCDIKSISTSGCISPYLEEEGDLSLFSSVGLSERPDAVCGKIVEGRIAVLIDGSPTVLIVPYLFVEYFHNIDDYTMKPYFASLNRIIKFIAFFIAILLPGCYVGFATFNPELIPSELLNKISLATGSTPFSLMMETLIIHFLYEIMRESGLRLPQNLGHAVSIVGGLVVGDAAVNAGLIGAPTIMVVALTSISTFVIPNLYEPIALLRFLFIIAGGTLGIWGIMILFSVVLVNLCSKSNFGIPFTSPISPFGIFGMRDTVLRTSWKSLSKNRDRIQEMPGSKY